MMSVDARAGSRHDQWVMNVSVASPVPPSPIAPPASAPVEPKSSASSAEPRDWTVLLYLDGNNDIERDVLNAFLTAEQVSRIDRATVVAQLARAPQAMAHPGSVDRIDGDWSGVRRYTMDPGPPPRPYDPTTYTPNGVHNGRIDSPVVQDLGTGTDMSRGATLRDFLEWGIRSYPARHYMVVLADHGKGFLGTLTDQVARREMRLPELHETLHAVRESTGVKPDLLVMDACLMAATEAACEVRDDAGLYVASEDVNYDCYPLQATLDHLAKGEKAGQDVSPRELGKAMVEACGTRMTSYPYVSMIDLEKMGPLVDAVGRLAERLLSTDAPRDRIRQDFASAVHFSKDAPGYKPYEDYRDLAHVAEIVAADARIGDPALKAAAAEVARMMRTEVVIDQRQHKGRDGQAGGLSIYLPPTGFDPPAGSLYPDGTKASDIAPAYRELEFARLTGWDKVIEAYAVPPKR